MSPLSFGTLYHRIDRKDLDDDGFTLEIFIEETKKKCFRGVISEPEISCKRIDKTFTVTLNLLIEVHCN